MLLTAWIKWLPVFIYDFFISTFLTVPAHQIMISHMGLSSGNFLDVGCGTGAPLQRIIDPLKQHHSKIVGVDLHQEYTKQAQKRFEEDGVVEIYHLDFYKISEHLKMTYRFILFSFSFMLMPDPLEAISLSKRILERDSSSRIGFILTLNRQNTSLLSKLKPLIRRVTTIDFGQVVYEDAFLAVLGIGGLKIEKKVRIRSGMNILLWLFPVYYVECSVLP